MFFAAAFAISSFYPCLATFLSLRQFNIFLSALFQSEIKCFFLQRYRFYLKHFVRYISRNETVAHKKRSGSTFIQQDTVLANRFLFKSLIFFLLLFYIACF